ncbi:MAG: glycosyltransferase [Solirubrobacteraceae bacterium]
MRAHILDPAAYTPPYDHALCAALARAGVDTTLYTSRFAYDETPEPQGYARRELFYRVARRLQRPGARRWVRLAEHVPDMLRYRRLAARDADVVHFQWLPVQQLDVHLLPAGPPLVLTAHDVLPREPTPGQRAAQRRLYTRMDAVVVHTQSGRERLVSELGLDPASVHVIRHGVLEHARDGVSALPQELRTDRAVVLCFGLLRPYKGLDLLLEAWRGIEDAELWIVGMPRMDISGLRASAPAGVRWVPRFVGARELGAYFERADLLVLPYREIDQSGVAFTALGFGKPMLLSDVGGFPELAADGAAALFPAGDVGALRVALEGLLRDRAERDRLAAGARAAAAGPYAWEAIAARTRELYDSLIVR